MQMTTAFPAFAISALMALGACTASNAGSDTKEREWLQDARLGEKVDRVCFKSSIDSFRSPTDKTVIVEEGVNDEYLIETTGNCPDLDWAQSISFDTPRAASCVTRGDSIYAYDSVFGPDNTGIAPIRCPISAIYVWNEESADKEADMDGEE